MKFDAFPFPEGLSWINTASPLSLQELRGHVILLDFWTYSCINCINVIPDIKSLELKYQEQPFVIIGVHSPKYDNEKSVENVKAAIKRYKIDYPVIVDNDCLLCDKYGIKSRPSFILISTNGKIIGAASGEGKKDLLNSVITSALVQGKNENTLAKERINLTVTADDETLLAFPRGIEIDTEGKFLFIADSSHNRIIQIELMQPDKGKIINVIGNKEPGLQDGTYGIARFYQPQGLEYHKGLLFVADTGNHVVREIDIRRKNVRIIAGSGKKGYTSQYFGDSLTANLSSPWDLTVGEPYLYITLAGSHQVWRLDLKTREIETFVGTGKEGLTDGTGESISLAQPSGIDLDGHRLYFIDSESSALRYFDLNSGETVTCIGKGLFEFGMKDGTFDEAQLQHPIGIEAIGDQVYIADAYNHAIRMADIPIRILKSVIDSPEHKVCIIDDKTSGEPPLYEPHDVIYHHNKLYIADTNNHTIRCFDLETRQLKNFEIIDTWGIS